MNGNAPTQLRPRWSMVISHHPPSQYDRTLHFGSIRVCARCSGLVGGILVGILSPIASTGLAPAVVVGLALGVIIVGIWAFVLNEAATRASSNVERILFGLLLGLALAWTLQGGWPYFAGLLGAIVGGQFASAFVLRRLGVLDRFFDEYLSGAIIQGSGEEAVRCGQMFCKCGPSSFRFQLDKDRQ